MTSADLRRDLVAALAPFALVMGLVLGVLVFASLSTSARLLPRAARSQAAWQP